jgi:hypothetical protein
MENTYTYIARSEANPARVATFTLHNGSLSVGFGPAGEQVERIAQIGQEVSADKTLKPMIKPATVRLMQYAGQEFDIADVDAQASDESLLVRLWTRTGGLRVAPITFSWQAVDNPDAADAFVAEIDRRKKAAARPGWFTGLLDYWITWIIGGVLLAWLVKNQLRRDS